MLRKRFYIKKRCYRWPLESAFKSAFVGSFIIKIKNSYHHFSIVLHEIIKALNQSSAAVSIYEEIFVTITTCHFSIRHQDLCLRLLVQDHRGSFRSSSSGPPPPFISTLSSEPPQEKRKVNTIHFLLHSLLYSLVLIVNTIHFLLHSLLYSLVL